jgi:hypothetical protein
MDPGLDVGDRGLGTTVVVACELPEAVMARPAAIVDKGNRETVRTVEPGQGAEDLMSVVRGFVEFRCRCV